MLTAVDSLSWLDPPVQVLFRFCSGSVVQTVSYTIAARSLLFIKLIRMVLGNF